MVLEVNMKKGHLQLKNGGKQLFEDRSTRTQTMRSDIVQELWDTFPPFSLIFEKQGTTAPYVFVSLA